MQKKKQHIVPKCYLENFTNKDGFLWALTSNGDEDKVIRIKPKNILTENSFYSIKFDSGEKSFFIEDTLSNIEGAFSSIFKNKISKRLPLTPEERAQVSIFIASMKHRTKVDRESMRKSWSDLDKKLDEWRKHFEANPKAKCFSERMFPAEEKDSFSQDEVREVLENFDNFHSISLIDNLAYIANIIFQMKWGFIMPEDENDEFITSDHPCVIFRPESIKKYGHRAFGSAPGLVYNDTELTIPLSSKVAIMTGWQIEKEAYVPMPTSFVEQINIRSIAYAQEKIIASKKEMIENIQEIRGFQKKID